MSLYARQTIGGLVGAFDTAIRENLIFADDGNVYHTIQGAIDNCDSYIRIGPGTFTENVLVRKEVTIEGSGYQTIIDGADGTIAETGTKEAIRVENPNVTITRLSLKTNPATGGNCITLSQAGSGSKEALVERVWILEGGNRGIQVQDDDASIKGVIIEDSGAGVASDGFVTGAGSTDCRFIDCYTMGNAVGSDGFEIDGADHIVTGCEIDGVTNNGMFVEGDRVNIGNNIILGAGIDGIHVNGEDCVIDGNILAGITGTAIDTATPTTVTVGDNHT